MRIAHPAVNHRSVAASSYQYQYAEGVERMETKNVFGQPFVKRFAYAIGSLSVCLCVCLSVCCPVSNVGVLWPNGWTDQDETWHAGRPRPGHIVLDGDPGPCRV